MRPQDSEPSWISIILVPCRIDGRAVIGALEVQAGPSMDRERPRAAPAPPVRFAA